MRKITVIGAPIRHGQKGYGVQLGPEALRSAGLIKRLSSISSDVEDWGDLDFTFQEISREYVNSKIRNLQQVARCVELLSLKVTEAINNGRFPLILGGDHSLAIGTIAGISQSYQNPGVIWIDAHADCNTPETSPSGNIQGMPLAVGLGDGHTDLVGIGGYNNKIKKEHVVIIGVRDMDAGEKEYIYKNKIKYFTTEAVYKMGINNVIDQAVDYLDSCDGIHLSYDLDVLDPKESLGVGTPVEEGIYLEDAISALKQLNRYNVITSAEFVEYNPILDKDERTAAAALSLIGAFLE